MSNEKKRKRKKNRKEKKERGRERTSKCGEEIKEKNVDMWKVLRPLA